jgi:multiple sugar transport system substrate-binding protein
MFPKRCAYLFRVSLFMLIVASLMASCSAAKPSTAVPNEPTISTEKPSIAATKESTVASLPDLPFKGKTLTVWIGGHAVEQEPIWAKIVKDFEDKTGAKVELSLIGFETYYDRLVAAYASGQPPDVAHADLGGWVPAFAAKGWIVPLDDRLAGWEGTDQIWPNLWPTVLYKGARYGLPWDTDCRFLTYNKQMFTKAGLDPEKPPVTWDEMLIDAQKMTDPAKGIYGYGVSGSMSELATLGYMLFLGGNGGRLLNKDYTQAAFNTPEGLEALKFYTELYTKYKVSPPGTPNMGEDEYRNAMAQGQIAMSVGGPWSWPLIYSANPDMKGQVGTAIHPYNKEPYSVLGGWASVIASDSKEKDLAWEWVSYYTSKDVWLYWLSQSEGPMPTRKDVTEAPLFQDPLWQTVLATFPHADARPPIPEYPEISHEIQLMVQNVITGATTPEKAIQTAADNVNKILNP